MPLVKDFFSLLLTVRNKATRKHLIQTGRDVRTHAFDARDTFPIIEHAKLSEFLGCPDPAPFVLPPIDTISLSGLGFVIPYTILATVVRALKPARMFETGTFRGVGSLTMALNAPDAEIYTLDLPETFDAADAATLTAGDKEWVRLSRTSIGFAFRDHPAAARIHQLRGDSLTFQLPPEVSNVDLCLIDGGHSYECVKADTQLALAALAPGGVILWDDYAWFIPGVQKYLRELQGQLSLARVAGSFLVIYKDPRPRLSAAN